MTQKPYALISVYDKTSIVPFAQQVAKLGYAITSSGGTAKLLKKNGIEVTPVEDITGNPERFDGRMKTISFQIESGILFDRQNKTHQKEAQELNIPKIDIVVCNFYPFYKVVKRDDLTDGEAIENIDVGGPTMMRAAAKNYRSVLPVLDPQDYEKIIDTLQHKQDTDGFRKHLAAKAFAYLSWYDSQIAGHLSTGGDRHDRSLPEYFSIAGKKLQDVRYGENPHQEAALYISQPTNSPLQHLKKLAGRDLSLLNVTDINAGLESVRMFTEPAAVVIKHNSPCGIALGKTAGEALSQAIEADPVSAFGGVIVTNKPIDKKTATIISSFKEAKRGNIDIVAAPSITDDALKLLSLIRKTMGIYTFDEIQELRNPAMNVKWIDGGFFVQDADDGIDESFNNWKVVTKKKPTQKQIEQMQVAWKFVTRIKSNAVIVVDKTIPMTRGIGAGQTSRVGATQLSLELAGDYSKGAILAGDSFFPFGDSVTLAAEHGIAAIVQQGGSINDQSSIDAANDAGIPMVFTGRRAFWH